MIEVTEYRSTGDWLYSVVPNSRMTAITKDPTEICPAPWTTVWVHGSKDAPWRSVFHVPPGGRLELAYLPEVSVVLPPLIDQA